MSCLFCKIAAGEIPSKRVHEDDELLAFEDIKPEAPVHILIVPRRHISTLNDLQSGDDALVGSMLRRAALIAKERGISESGYRTVMNFNSHAGQTVFHIHLHLLGGRRLSWPPG
jgi:histidine triad (HIT) family protein